TEQGEDPELVEHGWRPEWVGACGLRGRGLSPVVGRGTCRALPCPTSSFPRKRGLQWISGHPAAWIAARSGRRGASDCHRDFFSVPVQSHRGPAFAGMTMEDFAGTLA